MSGKAWKWVHFAFIFVFIALWGLAAIFGWLKSVSFVSHISMVALVYAAVSAWQAARTEQAEEKRDK